MVRKKTVKNNLKLASLYGAAMTGLFFTPDYSNLQADIVDITWNGGNEQIGISPNFLSGTPTPVDIDPVGASVDLCVFYTMFSNTQGMIYGAGGIEIANQSITGIAQVQAGDLLTPDMFQGQTDRFDIDGVGYAAFRTNVGNVGWFKINFSPGNGGLRFLNGEFGNSGETLVIGVSAQQETFDGINVLAITASAADDNITVQASSIPNQVSLTVNGSVPQVFEFVDKVCVDGGSGNDIIVVDFNGSEANIIEGGPGADMLCGGTGKDNIFGGNGADFIFGLGNDDSLVGGGADDYIYAGLGDDFCSGGTGDDNIFGEAGFDILQGGEGDDFISGASGDDIISGFGGRDELRGFAGIDQIFGGQQRDRIFGGSGMDFVSGQGGNDVVHGGADDDEVFGGAGTDQLHGNDGNDVLSGNGGNDFFTGGNGLDQFFGGAGSDTGIDEGEAGESSIEN